MEREKISTRINATHKACHVTYQLEISSTDLITASCPPNLGASSEFGFVIGQPASRSTRILMNESDASLKYLVKAFRYTALSNMDLEDARFLIWSKTI